MQDQPKGPLALSVLIIAVGVGWLLIVQGYGPGVDWVWTLGLAAVGGVTFILSGGLDKVSIVVGPFFLVTSVLSLLRQTKQVSADVEIPLIVIAVGVFLLLAQMPFVPAPKWFLPLPGEEAKGGDRR